MKKILFILLISFCSINVINADVMNRELVEEVFKKKISLEKTYFNELLNVRIDFSQEDYLVGEIIDIVIHFEVNKEKNSANYQFAIQDYKNKFLSSNCKKHRDQITKRDIVRRNKVVLRDTLCKFIECDSDLILNNEQSEGTYHIKFKLTGKSFGIPFFNKQYPYIFVSLSMNEFIYSEDHKYISDYFGTIDYPGGFRHLNIPIKLNNESFKKKSISTKPEIKGLPKALPERKNSKRSKLDSSIELKTRSRLTDIVLSGEVTECGINLTSPQNTIRRPAFKLICSSGNRENFLYSLFNKLSISNIKCKLFFRLYSLFKLINHTSSIEFSETSSLPLKYSSDEIKENLLYLNCNEVSLLIFGK